MSLGLTQSSAFVQGTPHGGVASVGPGQNRIWELEVFYNAATAATNVAFTVGGQVPTRKVNHDAGSASRTGVDIYVLTEAQIAAMSGSAIAITSGSYPTQTIWRQKTKQDQTQATPVNATVAESQAASVNVIHQNASPAGYQELHVVASSTAAIPSLSAALLASGWTLEDSIQAQGMAIAVWHKVAGTTSGFDVNLAAAPIRAEGVVTTWNETIASVSATVTSVSPSVVVGANATVVGTGLTGAAFRVEGVLWTAGANSGTSAAFTSQLGNSPYGKAVPYTITIGSQVFTGTIVLTPPATALVVDLTSDLDTTPPFYQSSPDPLVKGDQLEFTNPTGTLTLAKVKAFSDRSMRAEGAGTVTGRVWNSATRVWETGAVLTFAALATPVTKPAFLGPAFGNINQKLGVALAVGSIAAAFSGATGYALKRLDTSEFLGLATNSGVSSKNLGLPSLGLLEAGDYVVLATGPVLVQEIMTAALYDYYVSPTGSNSNAGTIGSPWAYAGLATKTIAAGKSVGLLPGTYVLSIPAGANPVDNDPLMTIAIGGADASHRTLVQSTTHLGAVFTSNNAGAYPQGTYSALRVTGSHIVVKGVKFSGFSSVGLGLAASDIIFEDCEISDLVASRNSGYTPGDNISGIYGKLGADIRDIVFRNCTLHDVWDNDAHAAGTNCGAAGPFYYIHNILFEDCHFYNSGIGVGPKRECGTVTIRRCFFSGLKAYAIRSMLEADDDYSTERIQVYNCVFALSGVITGGDNPQQDMLPRGCDFHDCTIVYTQNAETGVSVWSGPLSNIGQSANRTTDNKFYNVIEMIPVAQNRMNSGFMYFYPVAMNLPTDRFAIMDYNCRGQTAAEFRMKVGNTTYDSFAAWQAAYGFDAHSIVADPLLVNPAGTTPEDYKLQDASPCKGAGRVGGLASGLACDMGAWNGVSSIGYKAQSYAQATTAVLARNSTWSAGEEIQLANVIPAGIPGIEMVGNTPTGAPTDTSSFQDVFYRALNASGFDDTNLFTYDAYIEMPDLSGNTDAEAQDEMTTVGLVPSPRDAYHPSIALGSVIAQDEPALAQKKIGDTVGYTVSAGPAPASTGGVQGGIRINLGLGL